MPAASGRAGDGRLTWGILPTAHIAGEVIPGLQRSQANTVTAVASRQADRAERFAKHYQLPVAYGSYEDLLADPEIDCVYICCAMAAGAGAHAIQVIWRPSRGG